MTYTDGIDPTYPRMWDSIDAKLADTIEAAILRRHGPSALDEADAHSPGAASGHAENPPSGQASAPSSAAESEPGVGTPEADASRGHGRTDGISASGPSGLAALPPRRGEL